MMFGAAVRCKGSMFEPVEEAGEPAVVPVGGGGHRRIALLICELPRKPECCQFLDELGVLVPPARDPFGERIPRA